MPENKCWFDSKACKANAFGREFLANCSLTKLVNQNEVTE
jgi:hypothetical protein